MTLSTSRRAWFALVVLGLVGAGSGWGQEPPATPALPRAVAPVRVSGARFTVAGRPTALSWAFGLRDPADLPIYTRAGFNAVYIDLTNDASLAPAQALADAAERAGLPIIVGLNAIEGAVPGGALVVAQQAQVDATTRWLTQTVEQWSRRGSVVAWALQHDVEAFLAWPRESFAAWCLDHYRESLHLAAAWGYPAEIGPKLDPGLAAVIDGGRPGRLGRASVDVGRWRATSVASLLRTWTRAVQAADPTRPVLGGRMTLGRTLLVAPEELAGLQPASSPSQPGAIMPTDPFELTALASQGQRFAAVPCLDGALPPVELIAQARRAVAGGPAGLSFAGWPALAADAARLAAISLVLTEYADLRVAEFRPMAGAAIVLSPWQRGPDWYGPNWYGYSDLGGSEPAGLLDQLRVGTRFGAFDVLTTRDLATVTLLGEPLAGRADLSRYGCLYLPAAWALDEAQTLALAAYAQAGGTVVTDLGVASEGFRGARPTMAQFMADLLGVQPVVLSNLADVVLQPSLRDRMRRTPPGQDPLDLLPKTGSVPGAAEIYGRPEFAPELGDIESVGERAARAQLAGPALFVVPRDGTQVVAQQASMPARLPDDAPRAGWYYRPLGDGGVFFASGLLWDGFGLGDALYAPLHEALWRLRRPLTVVADVASGATFAARGEQQLWLARRAPVAGPVVVDVPFSDGAVLGQGLNVFRRDPEPSPGGEPTVTNRVVTALGPGDTRLALAGPVRVWPLGQAAAAQVTAYGPDGVELWLYGAGDSIVPVENRFAVAQPRLSPLLLTVFDGQYVLRPGTQHRVELRSFAALAADMVQANGGVAPAGQSNIGAAGVDWQTATVDEQGSLTLHGAAATTRVRIKPAGAAFN